MNKQPFRLFHVSRRVSSFTFGSLLVAIPMILLSVIATIVLLPFALVAFVLELPQAIVTGVDNSGKFTANLSTRLTIAWDALFDRDAQLVEAKKHFDRFDASVDEGDFYQHKVEYKDGDKYDTYTLNLRANAKPVLANRTEVCRGSIPPDTFLN